jgi:hypothetical protein
MGERSEVKVAFEPKKILHGMTQIYENDFMCGYEGEDKAELRIIFLELILAVTRYVNDYRYCSSSDCRCCPEWDIRSLVKRHKKEIFENLLGGSYGLSEVPLLTMRNFLKQF